MAFISPEPDVIATDPAASTPSASAPSPIALVAGVTAIDPPAAKTAKADMSGEAVGKTGQTPADPAEVTADPAAPAPFAQDRAVDAINIGAPLVRGLPAIAPSHGNSSPAAPRDFAALVDRLVEARQAFAPSAVTAAVAHSDFGRVTLNFRSEGDSLAVSMASADPSFAPAVQAAAQSFGTQSNLTDSSGGSQPRSDQASGSSGQASASSQGSGQTTGQQADQGSAHRSRSAGPSEAAAGQERERRGEQDEARDIYA